MIVLSEEFWVRKTGEEQLRIAKKLNYKSRATLLNNFFTNGLDKITRYQGMFAGDNFKTFVKSFFSDKEIKILLLDYRFNNITSELVNAITDEEQRLAFIATIEPIGNKFKALKQLKNPENLIKFLENYDINDYNVTKFIFKECLTDDTYKYNYIINNFNKKGKSIILLSEFINNEYYVKKILYKSDILNLKDQDISFLLNLINDKTFVYNYVLNHKVTNKEYFVKMLKVIYDDEDKIEIINKNISNPNIVLFIISLSKGENIKRFLSLIEDEETLILLSKYSTSDFIKYYVLTHIQNEKEKLTLFFEFKSDTYKFYSLNSFKNRINYLTAICSLSNDENKIKVLGEEHFTKEEQSDIIQSFRNKSLKVEYLMQLYQVKETEMFKFDFKRNNEILDFKSDNPMNMYTYGVEIEAKGELAPLIREMGEDTKDILKRKQSIKLLGLWDIKSDSSLYSGVEFSSKVLSYKYEDINQIYNVCKFSQANNLFVDDDCGGHLHIGINTIQSVDTWNFLFYIYCNTERIFYLISNEKEEIPRINIEFYAKPVSKFFKEFLDGKKTYNMEDYIEQLKGVFESHYSGVNIDNIFYVRDTIEFRIPNGNLNPECIQKNIVLFSSLIRLANKLSLLPPTKELYELIDRFDKEPDESVKLELLLKLLFKEASTREIFRERYYINKKIYDNEPIEVIEENSLVLKKNEVF